jgi:hypothetical protein
MANRHCLFEMVCFAFADAYTVAVVPAEVDIRHEIRQHVLAINVSCTCMYMKLFDPKCFIVSSYQLRLQFADQSLQSMYLTLNVSVDVNEFADRPQKLAHSLAACNGSHDR